MKTLYWTTREYVFAAIIVVGLMLAAKIIIPLTMPLRIPGLANTIYAPFSALVLTIGLIRLKKPGSLLLIVGIYALISLSISLIITGFLLVGGIAGELAGTFVFRGYRGRIAPVVSTVLFEMGMFPGALIMTFFFFPERYTAIGLWILLAAEAAILVTSLVGCFLGLKIAGELARAGKLSLE